MGGPHDTVRLDTPLDERAAFAFAPAASESIAERPQVVVPDRVARERAVPAAALSLATAARLRPALDEAIATEWERGTAFLFVPVLLAAGAFTYFALAREPSFAEIAASVAAVGLAAWLARSRLVLHLALAALLCFALGLLFAKVETWRAGTSMLGGEISTRLTGRVAVIEHQASGRIRLTIDIIGTERPKLKFAPDRVRVSAAAIPEGLRAGEVVVGVARLAPPSGPTRPGGYDFSFESYFDGIGANGFFFKPPQRVATAPKAGAAAEFLASVENLRSDLANRIRTAIGGAEGEIAAALIAGVRAGIPEDVNEALRRTGLAHVLSISGLHMALVAATIMVALRAGFALFPAFASRRPVKKYAAGAALVALAVYLFISGSAVAAERSFLMIGIMLLAVFFDRSALTMRNLAIAAIVIIALSPHEVAGPSFQMSFAATAALIGAYAAWSERRRRNSAATPVDEAIALRVLRKTGGYIVGLAATSLIAGAATAIFGAYHFQRVSPLGLAANLAAMPVVSVAVMPFALIGMVLMPFGLDGWAFAVVGKGLAAMLAIADWFSQMSPLDAVGLVPAGAVAVLTVALIAATLPTTWLRLAALPVAVIGVAMISARTLPQALVSEDGRLVVLRTADGALAINRARPNAFTTEDWQRALNSGRIVKPMKVAAGEPLRPREGDDGFRCASDICTATIAGSLIVHAANAAAAEPFCATASLIVVDDATAENPCPKPAPKVLTKRDLARRGAASVSFGGGSTEKPMAELALAIDEPYRPWHAHRAFSREARGLPPYQRKKPGSAATDTAAGSAVSASEAARRPPEISSGGSTRPAGPAP